jgi:hypothetical protein
LCLGRLQRALEMREGNLAIEPDDAGVRNHLAAGVGPSGSCGQLAALKRLEVALRNLGLAGDLLEADPAPFARAAQ